MRVFVTGASGFIGSRVVPELLSAGHHVTGLARSDASADALRAAGAEVRRGDIDDRDGLRAAAAASDGVIHLAFIHDFSKIAESAAIDARAVEALGTGLEGSGKPLVIAGGLLALAPGRVATEHDEPGQGGFVSPRQAGVRMALSFAARGVRPSIVRLSPSVHGPGDKGFVPHLVRVARERGVAGYVGDGATRWPAVHVMDAARLFRLALENAPAGARLHGCADEGIPTRAIAKVIAKRLNVPLASVPQAEATSHFGFLGPFMALDSPASSALTRAMLGWKPTHPGLLEDLAEGDYFSRSAHSTALR